METFHLTEPNLEFGHDLDISPTSGIAKYSVFDINDRLRPEKLIIGIVGSDSSVRKTVAFLKRCNRKIPAKKSKQPNLYPSFCGFHKNAGFHSEIVVNETITKSIPGRELKEAYNLKNIKDKIIKLVDLYLERIDFIRQTKNPDVIICSLPKELINATKKKSYDTDDDDQIEKIENKESNENPWEVDFRRLIKAQAMLLPCNAPLQLVAETNLESGKANQDDATMAWNFCTALYYKANGTPWRLPHTDFLADTCYVGVSFYKSRDRESTQTSLAQIFNEFGKGVILMGGKVEKSKIDLSPHLNRDQSIELINKALGAYKITHDHFPSRVVLHKTSNFNDDELEGFNEGIRNLGISRTDFVTIRDSQLKLFRSGQYPVMRGTGIKLNDQRFVLYTRGSVRYYETYAGKYVPQALEIIVPEGDSDPFRLCGEILSLTKMNWNNTRYDGKYPITVECSRRVGEILKYLPDGTEPQSRYSFYM